MTVVGGVSCGALSDIMMSYRSIGAEPEVAANAVTVMMRDSESNYEANRKLLETSHDVRVTRPGGSGNDR